MATNSTERELLETLVKKLNDSAALNGGFDKLYVMIEHIQDKQEESGTKLDKVSDAMYHPDNGLFSRVKKIESKLDTNIGELEKKVQVVPDVRTEVQDLKRFQKAVEGVVGPQLEELFGLVKLHKSLSNLYWALALSAAGAFATLIFNLLKHVN